MSEILIVDGHPRPGSFGDALTMAYAEGAREAGRTVQVVALRDLQFDPVLHQGYAGDQAMEPDLLALQDAIQACRHFVLVYPIWWGGMPAQMKGFVDRVFLPGFAFKYHKGRVIHDQLLKGRSARVIVTMDAPPWYDLLVYRAGGMHLARTALLKFCGFHPVHGWRVGPVKHSSQERREKWLLTARRLGATDG
jgi:NAD(P)H dehydrogenase (quinone)